MSSSGRSISAAHSAPSVARICSTRTRGHLATGNGQASVYRRTNRPTTRGYANGVDHADRRRASVDHLGRRPHPRAAGPVAAGAAGVAARPGPEGRRARRSKLEFTGGALRLRARRRRRPLVRPLAVRRPRRAHRPAARRRPASRRRSSDNVPAIYEDFRPGTYDQTARLADMDLNHVEAAINYPNTFPRFAGQGFAERDDKDLALACLQIYNDWMIDEWCGGAGQGPAHPAHARAAVGPAAGRRRGAALRGQGQLRHRLHREPVQARLRLAVHRRVGRAVGRRARRPTRRCRCTSARRRRCRPRRPTRRWPRRCRSTRRTPQGSLCDWVFSGTLERFPDAQDRLRREPGRAGCRSSSSAWTRVWHEGVGGVELAEAAERAT